MEYEILNLVCQLQRNFEKSIPIQCAQGASYGIPNPEVSVIKDSYDIVISIQSTV